MVASFKHHARGLLFRASNQYLTQELLSCRDSPGRSATGDYGSLVHQSIQNEQWTAVDLCICFCLVLPVISPCSSLMPSEMKGGCKPELSLWLLSCCSYSLLNPVLLCPLLYEYAYIQARDLSFCLHICFTSVTFDYAPRENWAEAISWLNWQFQVMGW